MKHKPGSLSLIVLTALFAIGIPSCDGPDYYAIRDIDNVDIVDLATRQILPVPTSTQSDSIALIISTRLVEFASHIPDPGFMNEAWATSPPRPVMANEIIDIRIFCDQSIYGLPAGENLSAVLGFGALSIPPVPLSEYLADFLPGRNQYPWWILYEIAVYFTTKPPSGIYNFRVEMEDNNHHIFEASFPTLEWL